MCLKMIHEGVISMVSFSATFPTSDPVTGIWNQNLWHKSLPLNLPEILFSQK